MINSFFPWIGGKKLLRDIILERFPINYDRYIEVFGGAAWILFAKQPEPFEVYNDYNSDLTNLFYVIKYRPLAFLEELGWLPLNGREEFDLLLDWNRKKDFSLPYLKDEMSLAKRYLKDVEYREYTEMLEEKSKLGDVRRAVIFYKLIRYSYAGESTSYNAQPTNIMQTYKTIWLANRRLNENGAKSTKELQKADGIAGKGVIIQNRSYETLVPMFDRPSAFFYCDPPYYGTEKLYMERFSLDDHYSLNRILSSIQGRFMLSYNDCEFIRDLYKDFNIETVERLNSISQRYDPGNMFKEVLIANYDMNERRKKQPSQLSLL
ncbi:DNA adenine methylase [Lachnospiraceae bacterium NSJ-143]|nr:DNA adenine methylase [Lachnospiraceae bacterium NSJ-143]